MNSTIIARLSVTIRGSVSGTVHLEKVNIMPILCKTVIKANGAYFQESILFVY